MKSILIPTDYQSESLPGIHAVCGHFKNEDLNLVFVHVFKLTDSFSDIITLSRRSRDYEKVSDDFYKYCNVLRAQFPQIKNIKIDFLYGSKLSMFKQFIEHNQIDMVLNTEGGLFTPIHATSVNPALLIKRSGLPVIDAEKNNYPDLPEQPITIGYQQEELLEV